jgi:hypothetical protein
MVTKLQGELACNTRYRLFWRRSLKAVGWHALRDEGRGLVGERGATIFLIGRLGFLSISCL